MRGTSREKEGLKLRKEAEMSPGRIVERKEEGSPFHREEPMQANDLY